MSFILVNSFLSWDFVQVDLYLKDITVFDLSLDKYDLITEHSITSTLCSSYHVKSFFQSLMIGSIWSYSFHPRWL